MSTDEGAARITLSRETLRAELAQLELRLVDRLTNALQTKADNEVVEQLAARVGTLELSRAAREHLGNDLVGLERRVVGLEKFRWAFPSAAALSTAAAIAAVVITYIH